MAADIEDGMEESRNLDQTVRSRWKEKVYSFLGPDALKLSAGEAILLLQTLEEDAARILRNQADVSMHTVHPTEKEGGEASRANENHKAHTLRMDRIMHFPDLTALYSAPSSSSFSSSPHKNMGFQN